MNEEQLETAPSQQEEFVYIPPNLELSANTKMLKLCFPLLVVLAVVFAGFIIKDNLSALFDIPRLTILLLLILFEVLILKFIYNSLFVSEKITLKKDGLYLRSMHTTTWDAVEAFYINSPVIYIVFKKNAVSRYTDSIDLALNFGSECNAAAEFLRKYIPETFKESPGDAPII